jgi:hypothetical protein
MIRGVNDDQLRPVLRFTMDNNDFIYQLRARVGVGVGRRVYEKNIYLSQFIRMFAEAVNVDYEALIDYWLAHSVYPNANLFAINYTDFLMRQNIDVFSKLEVKPPGGPFQVALFSWPEKDNIDYEEIEGLDLQLLTREKTRMNFFEAVILNEKGQIL